MQNVKMQVMEINRLTDNTASPSNVDAKARLQGFIEATEEFELRHLSAAVSGIIKGKMEGHNMSFPVYPPQLANECRKHRDAELRSLDLDKKFSLDRPVDPNLLPPPERSPEQRAAARKLMEDSVAKLSGVVTALTPEEQAAKAKADRAYMAKHDHMFVDPSPAAMARRLGLPHVQQPHGRQERQFTQDPD